MNTLNVLIIDDEPIAQNILEFYCGKLPNINLVGKCSNAIEAAAILLQHKVDVIFLDINMPEISGIDFVKSMNYPLNVIFTTAYSEYAVLSYELNALDYLVKPISFERFFSAINKVSKINPAHHEKIKEPESLVSDRQNFIYVRSEGKFVRINLDDVLYIEGLKDYVKFCFSSEKIIVHGTLKKTEEYLLKVSPAFIRVHKSYILNTKIIKEFGTDSISLMSTTVKIPLGQTYVKNLEKMIFDKRY